MTKASASRLGELFKAACSIRGRETLAVLSSFALVFLLMACYYILRPLRDAMASDWSDAEVSLLWTLTFFISLLVVTAYGGAVARIRFRWLVPFVYTFFAASFLLFYAAMQSNGADSYIEQGFYVWISVFSLFHISVFWSLMADIYNREQALRLFGFIGAGASAGALAGPTLTTLMAQQLGLHTLMLIACLLLLCTLPLILWLQRLKYRLLDNPGEDGTQPIGGNPFAGYREFFRHPFLLGIGAFILLYTSLSSFVYFELKNLLVDMDRVTRTQIWAGMDLAVNSLTLLIAIFATGHIARRFGLAKTLALLPALLCLGMLLLSAIPLVPVIIAIQVLRRAGNYGLTRPAREMLYTAVDRETRFKVKPVIDIVVYRGGDMLNAWAFTALTQGLGLGLGAVAAIGSAIAALWAAVGIYLGRRFHRHDDDIR